MPRLKCSSIWCHWPAYAEWVSVKWFSNTWKCALMPKRYMASTIATHSHTHIAANATYTGSLWFSSFLLQIPHNHRPMFNACRMRANPNNVCDIWMFCRPFCIQMLRGLKKIYLVFLECELENQMRGFSARKCFDQKRENFPFIGHKCYGGLDLSGNPKQRPENIRLESQQKSHTSSYLNKSLIPTRPPRINSIL